MFFPTLSNLAQNYFFKRKRRQLPICFSTTNNSRANSDGGGFLSSLFGWSKGSEQTAPPPQTDITTKHQKERTVR